MTLINVIGADIYVRLQSELIVIGDSIITDCHHASNGNYDADNPQNQIGGIIPAFSLSGWLRHGMEQVIHNRGGPACHPGEANANFRKVVTYRGDRPGETVKNGLRRVGSHSRYGFGELRVQPLDDQAPATAAWLTVKRRSLTEGLLDTNRNAD